MNRELAEQALASVQEQFAGYAPDSGPELREDNGIWSNAPYSIYWPYGPDCWTYNAWVPINGVIPGIFAEPQNEVVLCLWNES